MLLNETILGKHIIEEISREKLPDGVLCRVSYPICNIGERNANNRVYEASVWEKVFADADIKESMEKRCLFGHAEHPEQTQSNLEKTCHVITDMWESSGKVWQKFDILDTPTGRIVDCLLRADCQVGCSTRAEGDLEEAEDDEGSFQRVVTDSYSYKTTDFTADPSTQGSIPHDIKRNIVSEAKKIFETEDMDVGEAEFAEKILESMQCKKSKNPLHGRKCRGCGCCEALKERKILMKENKQYIVEGVWALPSSTEKAQKLVDLIEDPSTFVNLHTKMWDLYGTDTMYDELDGLQEEVLPEAVKIVKRHLKSTLETYDKDPESFKTPFDNTAIDVLRGLLAERKIVLSLLKEGIIKEGASVEYVFVEDATKYVMLAKVDKIEESKVTLLVGEMDPTTVAVDGNAHVSVTPEGLITILSSEAMAEMTPSDAEQDMSPAEVLDEPVPEELPEEPIEDESIPEELPEEPVEDEIPESKKHEVGDAVTIVEGDHKDKQGKIDKIDETGITVSLDDGTTVNIEDPSAVNITVTSPESEEEVKPVEPEEEVAPEEPIEEPAVEEPVEDEELGEAKVATKGGVSDRLADGNLLQDKDGKHWVVTELTDAGLLVTQPGEAGTEKSLGWDEVSDWGFTKLAEKLEECVCHIYGLDDSKLLEFYQGMGDDWNAINEPFGSDKAEVEAEITKRGLEIPVVVETAVNEKSIVVGDIVQIKDLEGNTTPVPEATVYDADDDTEGNLSVEVTGSKDEDRQQWYGEDKYQIILLKKTDESISTTVKEIKDLKIQEASTRAERDKAVELLEELTDEKQKFESKVTKDKTLEIKMLVNKMKQTLEAKEQEVGALRSKLEEKAKLVAEQKKLVSEARANSLKGITDLTESVAVEAKLMKADWQKSDENHAKELDQISEALKLLEKQREEASAALEEKIKETEKSVTESVTEKVTKEVTAEFVKRFVEFRLSESGLKVDENSRALLEQSTSLEDVDNLLDEIVDASRRSALHSEAIRGIRVPKHTIPDPEGDRIKRNVSSVYEGMNG